MRRPVVAGNIKMNLSLEATLELFREVWSGLTGEEAAQVLYFPPFTMLAGSAELLRNSPIGIGGQNLHWAAEGAYTGEVSARMLLECGCEWVLVGHSERRTLFGETDETVNRKTQAALAHGLRPVVCVGETLEEREAGRTEAVLERQVRLGLAGIDAAGLAKLVIAYEPVWAIGTGRTASPAQADEAHRFIRARVGQAAGPAAAEAIRILYGGSVKADNAAGLLGLPDIDGALVGGACLTPASFVQIIQAAG